MINYHVIKDGSHATKRVFINLSRVLVLSFFHGVMFFLAHLGFDSNVCNDAGIFVVKHAMYRSVAIVCTELSSTRTADPCLFPFRFSVR